MISQGGRAIGRLPQLKLQCTGVRRANLSCHNLERVTAFYNDFQTRHLFGLARQPAFVIPVFRRAYASKPVSRPKAHTGRTTTAARKAPTTSKTKAAKKPAPRTKAAKARPKAKPKAKPKTAKKPKAKPKRKPKALTETQKEAATIRRLRAAALTPPKNLPATAWTVFAGDSVKDGHGSIGDRETMAKMSQEFKQFTPERLEHYNHIANQNKAANEKAYRQWIESHTPTAIHEANLARLNLKRRKVRGYNKLQDHRQVKGRLNAYALFIKDRLLSGDMKGLKTLESFRLSAREWKGLSASERKPYDDAAKQDATRYAQEIKTVYNRDVTHSKPRAKAAAAA